VAEQAGHFSAFDLAELALREAETLLGLGRPAEAARAAQLATSQVPTDPRGWALLSLSHLAVGEPRPALPAANHAVGLDPQHGEWHLLASRCLSALGMRQAAVVAARRAVQLNPLDASTHQRLAIALADQRGGVVVFGYRLGRDVREAAEHAGVAMSLAPDAAQSHFTVAVVAAHGLHIGLAREHYLRTLAIDPGHAAARHNLALLERQRGRFRTGKAGLVGTLQVDPQLDVARRSLGRTLWAQLLVVHTVGVLTYLGFAVAAAGAILGPTYQLHPHARAAAALAVTVLSVGWLVHTWQRTPPAVRLFLRRQLGTKGWLLVAVLLDAFVITCWWAAALGQGEPVGRIILAGIVAMPIIALCLHASRQQAH
nr:hypothetical protein [Pseudonocardiales bacterium]